MNMAWIKSNLTNVALAASLAFNAHLFRLLNQERQPLPEPSPETIEMTVDAFEAAKKASYKDGKAAGISLAKTGGPYNPFRDVIMENGGTQISFPAEFLLNKTDTQREIELKKAAEFAKQPGRSGYVVWGADKNNINGRRITIEGEKLIQDEEHLEVVLDEAIKLVEQERNRSDSKYQDDTLTRLTYRFKRTVTPHGDLKLDVVEDPNKRGGSDAKTLKTFDLH